MIGWNFQTANCWGAGEVWSHLPCLPRQVAWSGCPTQLPLDSKLLGNLTRCFHLPKCLSSFLLLPHTFTALLSHSSLSEHNNLLMTWFCLQFILLQSQYIFLMTKNPGHALNNPNHDYYYPWIIIMATITIIQIPIEIIKMMIRKIRMSGRASRSTTCGHVFHSHCLRSTIVIITNSSINSRHISRSKSNF